MVLSETRGLWLSWVVRGGIGFGLRLGAISTLGLPSREILSLEPERLKNPIGTAGLIPEEEADSVPKTLKLLAFLIVRRRNTLLSSRALK
jgi:hypothetical protein